MEITEDDRRAEQAKASLLARIEELGNRMKNAREKLDIKAHIANHPRIAVGVAFALGALLGIPGKAKTVNGTDAERGLAGAAAAGFAALALRLVKDLAFRQLSGAAHRWIEQQQGDVIVSHEPAMESFVRH